jgi:predicted enzyme related to lactoylglutathione lyase
VAGSAALLVVDFISPPLSADLVSRSSFTLRFSAQERLRCGNSSHGREPFAPRRAADNRSAHSDRVGLVVDWRLELVQVPVSDVDRAKAFYTEKAGFNADYDEKVGDEIRFVQLTPPGSGCSIALGTGLAGRMRPGSVEGLQLVVSDIHAARKELVERGVEVSEVQEFDWGSFVFFSDPDGNGWAVQQVPARD